MCAPLYDTLRLTLHSTGVRKYSDDMYQDAMRCFDALPICAVVSGAYGKFFCTHGGLSPFVRTVRHLSFGRIRLCAGCGRV